MSKNFRLLMISAMYENGGNTTHRFLDGHPQLHVYPFESQPGTALVSDALSATFPVKYRWPVFALDATPEQDYRAIIDEECKVRARTPDVSKFRHWPFDFSDDDRSRLYVAQIKRTGRSTARNMQAFFQSTFQAWKDYATQTRSPWYVGYSPIIVVDTERILRDLPDAHILHIVRNPWSAYADTKKRAKPLSLAHYTLAWTLNQYYALMYQKKYPRHVHVLRIEDILANPRKVLGDLCRTLGLKPADSLAQPSWNSQALDQVYPWGTIRQPTPQANRDTAAELSPLERAEVRQRTAAYAKILGYDRFI